MSSIEISVEFGELLKPSGWTADRQVPIEEWLTTLEGEGYAPNPLAIAILTSFGGLRVRIPAIPDVELYEAELLFDPLYGGAGEYDRVADWHRQIGVYLFPVAEELRNGFPIWAGDDGKMYSGADFGLYRIGDSFREAMDNLAFLKNPPVQCAE